MFFTLYHMGSLIHVLHLHVLALSVSVIWFAWYLSSDVLVTELAQMLHSTVFVSFLLTEKRQSCDQTASTRFRIINFIKYNPVFSVKKNKFCKSSLDQRKKVQRQSMKY